MRKLKVSAVITVIAVIGWSAALGGETTGDAALTSCLRNALVSLVGENGVQQIINECNNGSATNAVSGLTVTKATQQPSVSLAPLGAARIPFTKVTFTAGADGDVTVDNVVVERVGLSVDAVLESAVVLDEIGLQIGRAGYFNSEHQATTACSFTVRAGASRTLTIAGNRPRWSNASHAGMVAGLSLVGVRTSATVNGAFPITGAFHVINEGLAIGSVAVMRGSTDPGVSTIQYVGTSNHTFSAIRIVAGSAENVRIKAIRWYQSGSAVPEDLANIKTFVDGVPYEIKISADGKYYTTVFDPEILIERGYSKEVAIRGDIVNGAERTIDFDIEKRIDLYLAGDAYGFGIIPPLGATSGPPDGAAFGTADDPWYDAAQVTIAYGDITIATAATVPNRNISVNVPNQLLGAFTATVKGEPISVGRIGFNVKLENESAAADVDDITNITLVDENGAIVAGPVDGMASDSWQTTGSADGSVIFTDTVTFPIGVHSYFLKGRVRTDIQAGVRITLHTTPSSDFALVRGLTTGHTVTVAPVMSIGLQTMTAVSGSLTAGVPADTAKTYMAGAQQVVGLTFRTYATASSESVRTVNIPLVLSIEGMQANDISNVRLYDETTPVTTGSNVLNPSQEGVNTFPLDGIITPVGSSKTLTLRFDIKTGVTGTIQWSLPSDLSTMNSVGLETGNAITPVLVGDGAGPVITVVQHGKAVVTVDSVSPTKMFADTPDSLALVLNIEAADEQFGIRELAIESHVFRDGAWKPLAEYLAAFIGPEFRDDTYAVPYSESGSITAGRITLFRQSWDELLWVDTASKFPLELRVDTTGFGVGTKVRFRVVKLTGTGYNSGANYSVNIDGVASEVVVIGKEPRVQSFKVIGPSGETQFGLLRASGVPSGTYVLESSINLKEWVRKPWAPTTADAEGNLLFEFEILLSPREFFRVVSVP